MGFVGPSLPNQDEPGNAVTSGDGPSHYDGSFPPAFALLMLFMVIALPVLIAMITCYLDRRQVRVPQQQQPAQVPKEEDFEEWMKKREKRYTIIEKGLISKKIADHDELCDIARRCQQEEYGEKETTTVTPSSSPETIIPDDVECTAPPREEEGLPSECPICFDEFKAGDIVSWTSMQCCRHVFHHLCIKEWLQRQKECPLCREICLPSDQPNVETQSQETIQEKLTNNTRQPPQQYRSSHCFCCVEHGIVNVPVASFTPDSLISVEKLEAIQHRAIQCPSLEQLANIRVSELGLPSGGA